MYITAASVHSIVQDLRKCFPKLDITCYEAESGRSLVFEASKQISEHAAQFKYKRISYKKLTDMPVKDLKAVLTKDFNKL